LLSFPLLKLEFQGLVFAVVVVVGVGVSAGVVIAVTAGVADVVFIQQHSSCFFLLCVAVSIRTSVVD